MYLMALIRRMGVELCWCRFRWPCDSSLAGIAASNLARGMDVSLWWVLRVVR